MSKKVKICLVIFIVFGVFFGLNKWGGGAIRNMAFSITSPFQKILWNSGEDRSSFLSGFFEIKDLKREILELKSENFDFQRQVFRINELQEENKRLREALGLKVEKEFELVLTRSISMIKDGDIILIDKGREDGVVENIPIITSNGVFVGIVSDVFKNFAQVILISSKEQTFSVEIKKQEEGILAIAKGQGQGRIKIELIPEDVEIQKGDVVFSSSLGGGLPNGLLVGVVETIKQGASEPFQEAMIRPYFQEMSLRNLFLIKGFVRKGEQ